MKLVSCVLTLRRLRCDTGVIALIVSYHDTLGYSGLSIHFIKLDISFFVIEKLELSSCVNKKRL